MLRILELLVFEQYPIQFAVHTASITMEDPDYPAMNIIKPKFNGRVNCPAFDNGIVSMNSDKTAVATFELNAQSKIAFLILFPAFSAS